MKGQNCMIFCYAVIVMLLKLLYVELGYTDHRFRFKNVDKNGRIYKKESCVNIFFAEICWIFVSEEYIG